MGHTRLIIYDNHGTTPGVHGMRERAKKDAFAPITSQDRSVGWCNPYGPHLDLPTGVHEVADEGVVRLGVRVDAMTIPAGTVRLKARERARRIQEETNRGVWEEELKAIEEDIREEIRKTQTEAAKWFRVWWHVDDGEMYAETTSRTDLDDLRRMFEYATGGLVAEVATLGRQLVRCDIGAARAICRERPIKLGGEEDDADGQITETAVLDSNSLALQLSDYGSEFLLWVWKVSERNGGTWKLPLGMLHGLDPLDESWDQPEPCIIHPDSRLVYSVPGTLEDSRGYRVFEASAPRHALLGGATLVGYSLHVVVEDKRPQFPSKSYSFDLARGSACVSKESLPELASVSKDENLQAEHRHQELIAVYRILDYLMLAWARWAMGMPRRDRGLVFTVWLESSLTDLKRGVFERYLKKAEPKIQVEIQFGGQPPQELSQHVGDTPANPVRPDAGASAVARARAAAGAADA